MDEDDNITVDRSYKHSYGQINSGTNSGQHSIPRGMSMNRYDLNFYRKVKINSLEYNHVPAVT